MGVRDGDEQSLGPGYRRGEGHNSTFCSFCYGEASYLSTENRCGHLLNTDVTVSCLHYNCYRSCSSQVCDIHPSLDLLIHRPLSIHITKERLKVGAVSSPGVLDGTKSCPCLCLSGHKRSPSVPNWEGVRRDLVTTFRTFMHTHPVWAPTCMPTPFHSPRWSEKAAEHVGPCTACPVAQHIPLRCQAQQVLTSLCGSQLEALPEGRS